MMAAQKFSAFQLLDFPDNQREILLHLFRNGPTDSITIARDLNQDLAKVEDLLATLEQNGHIRKHGSVVEVCSGLITRRTSLPDYLWSAFLTTDRLYSEQDIAALRIAVPMLQFARARLSEFTDHGPGHALRVKALAKQLGSILNLSSEEHHLLGSAALFHDVGNVVDRNRHNIISQETVLRLAEEGKLPFTPREAELVGLLCRWHRKDYSPIRKDVLQGTTIRTGLLASTLRVADAMDIDYRRSDQGKKFRQVLEFFFPDELQHWNSADEIYGVRFHCTPDIHLQIFTKGKTFGNLQIQMLREDAASTPLQIELQQFPINIHPMGSVRTAQINNLQKRGDRRALLVFPFEPHSIVMAGVSLRHLRSKGYEADILCYAEDQNTKSELWEKTVQVLNEKKIEHVILIGNRLKSLTERQFLEYIHDIRSKNFSISILNRHEEYWHLIPDILCLGVEVILGGDWAYFWGDPDNPSVFEWGRVASLCTRDPTQATVELTEKHQSVTQGLIFQVYQILEQTHRETTSDLGEMAIPLLERIAVNDWDYFITDAAEFIRIYRKPLKPISIDGKVGILEQSKGDSPLVNYWMMEATIEKYGRKLVRNLQFNLPYLVFTWVHDEFIELLAINHWLEDTAIPIRLLYPGDIGPSPEGNESMIRVRLAQAKSELIIRRLVKACNQAEY